MSISTQSAALILTIPFIGTTLGSACVFLMKGELSRRLEHFLLGFASGVMTAAAVWSLLLPSIDQSAAEGMGKLAAIPAAIGVAAGMLALLGLDNLIPHLHLNSESPEGVHSELSRKAMLCLAVTIHNIPEGMAPGILIAGLMTGSDGMTIGAALTLAIGLAIQNFPEGAVISMPLAGGGTGKLRAFVLGTLSGAVEPLAGILTVFFAASFVSMMPLFLSFAAGAMLYVVIEELIPEASGNDGSDFGTTGFGFGFVLMMILDKVFG